MQAAAAPVSFTANQIEVGGTASDVAVGDLDGHNGPDLVAAVGENLVVLLNNGNGTFGPPHSYPAGCPVSEVELGDLVNPSLKNVVDGHLDAVYACDLNGGSTQYLSRAAGDGNGGFGAPDPHPELNFGPFWRVQPQSFGLAQLRAPGLPLVPVFGRSNHVPLNHPEYWNALCVTYDWTSAECLNEPEYPSIGPPVISGSIAESRAFTLGGQKGILDFGPASGVWAWSTRELAPKLPTTAEDFFSLTIGDLAGDGPDIISAAGTCGCGFEDQPAAGQLDVLAGTTGTGVPDQVGTKTPSAPGITNIATGDFDVDGHEDVIGTSYSYDRATSTSTGAVFVQSGNGAGSLGTPQMFPLSHSESFSRAPVRVADLDGNGGADAVAIIGGKVEVLLNNQSKASPVPTHLKPLSGIKGLPKVVHVDKHGNVLLGTAKNPPTASVGLTIVLPGAKTGKGKHRPFALARTSGRKKTVIGHVKVTIPPGKKRQLRVHLKRRVNSTLKTKLTVVATAADGSQQTLTRRLTIEPAKKAK